MGDRLTGKVAWVTGAGTGIGEAAALALADEGAIVVLTGRRAEPLERLAARIHQVGGVAHVQPGDLMDPATPQRIADHIKATLGRIDILANNAGLNIRERHWDKLSPHGIDQIVHGNLSSRAVLRHRRAAGHAGAEGRGDHPHRLDGRALHRRPSAGRCIPPPSTAWSP